MGVNGVWSVIIDGTGAGRRGGSLAGSVVVHESSKGRVVCVDHDTAYINVLLYFVAVLLTVEALGELHSEICPFIGFLYVCHAEGFGVVYYFQCFLYKRRCLSSSCGCDCV